MVRYKIVFSYDGSKFCGFQRQKNVRSVQGTIEDVLTIIMGTKIVIKGAGRTDAGVHALAQVATFDAPKTKSLKSKMNHLLNDVYIKNVKIVDDSFHARFSAKGKIYLYKIMINSHGKNPYYLCCKNIDVDKIRECSKLFLGEHDFTNFCSCDKESKKTIIYDIKVYKFGNKVIIKFVGAGFFRYMIRKLVGAMMYYAQDKINLSDIKKMLDCPNEPKQLPTVVANGLYLKKVLYGRIK